MAKRIDGKRAWLGAALVLVAWGCGAESKDGDGAPPITESPGGAGGAGGSAGASAAGTGAGAGASDAPDMMDPGDPPVAGMGDPPVGGTGGAAGIGGAGGDTMMPGEIADWPDPRGGCPDLHTDYPGDDACIQPPPPGEGLQIHIGPSNYDDPEEMAKFALGPGEEVSECWTYHTPNNEDVYYQGYTLSGRPGTHHIFNSMLNIEVEDGGGFKVCVDPGTGTSVNRIGSLPAAGKPYMPRQRVAPENAGVGRFLAAHQSSEADMHYFNFTEGKVLREFWLNLYYIPKDKVTEEGLEVRGMGGLSWAVLPIVPGTDQVYKYECPIGSDGRITGLAGHYHKHGKRQTVSIRRANGMRENLFEMYHYDNAAMFAFDSISTNSPITAGEDGAVSGPLDVFAGDVLEWECHIVNDDTFGLTYSNNVETGEMCNVFGVSIGPEINCVLP